MTKKVSNCCGADGGSFFRWADFTLTYEEAGLCPKCKEPCEYVEEDKLDNQTPNNDPTDKINDLPGSPTEGL